MSESLEMDGKSASVGWWVAAIYRTLTEEQQAKVLAMLDREKVVRRNVGG